MRAMGEAARSEGELVKLGKKLNPNDGPLAIHRASGGAGDLLFRPLVLRNDFKGELFGGRIRRWHDENQFS